MAELDIYHGINEGLCVVEVEFKSKSQAKKFKAPNWFGKDVTKNTFYKNSMLSCEELRMERPDLFPKEFKQYGQR